MKQLLLALLLLANTAYAKPKIIVFEGWLQGKDAQVSSMLRSIGYREFTGYAHNQVVRHPGEKTIVLGCSLGGDAALAFAKPGDVVITFDPRWQNDASYWDFLIPFQKPFTLPKGAVGYNFYRNFGFLPGYPVTGASNTKLPWYTQHASTPNAAKEQVRLILQKEWR
jgi:hypothetical protein